jgi:arginine deiminase
MLTAFADSEYGCLREVLLCHPGVQHDDTSNIAFPNLHEAKHQHENLVALLQDEGIRCHFMLPDRSMPYQTYMRDSFAITPWGFLLTKMAFKPRSNEPMAVKRFASKVGIPVWEVVSEGSLEGGDVQLLRPGYAVVGSNGNRTTMPAAQKVKKWFESKEWRLPNHSIPTSVYASGYCHGNHRFKEHYLL